MKHASEKTLDTINSLLDQIRPLPGLKERKPGIFYRKSKAFLHFHEDGDSIYADVRLQGPEFQRFPVTAKNEQALFLKAVKETLS